ncbi:MAG: acyl-CoA dehydrogenase, partial [Alphaproteobacteria bacterium]
MSTTRPPTRPQVDPLRSGAPITYPPDVHGLNAFDLDRNLQRLLAHRVPAFLARHRTRLSAFGAWVGGPLDHQAAYSDRHARPVVEAYAPTGEVRGRVIVNPAYESCHQDAYRYGVIGLAHDENEPDGHLVSFVMGYLLSYADIAIHCPVTMTGAVAHVLAHIAPAAVRAKYLPALIRMDGRTISAGTWATERHGGSDVGASATEARPDGPAWRLRGLKWFASNAGGGLALATARPAGAPPGGRGLGCYLVPQMLPDGTRNSYWVRRLKDKLGTRALPTGEIELDDAWALEVAAPPEGLKAMMEALEYSRIHNAMAACAVQRRAFLEAVCWATHRIAFGHAIASYPMVRDVLLDLATEQEAGLALACEAALAFAAAGRDPTARPWLRTVTALAKDRTAEAGVRAATRAIEVIGGNGYTEDWPTARLLRDAMVLPVWEGPPNIQALELLRVTTGKVRGDSAFLSRIEDIVEALPPALDDLAASLRPALDDCRAALAYLRRRPEDGPRHGRRLVEMMADTLCAALLAEEAAADLDAGDGRKALIARRYVRARFDGRLPITSDADPAQAAFAQIIG